MTLKGLIIISLFFSDYDLEMWHEYEIDGNIIWIDGEVYKILNGDKFGIYVVKLS